MRQIPYQYEHNPTNWPAMDMQPQISTLVKLGSWAAVLLFLGGLSFVSQYPPCLGYSDSQTPVYTLPYPVGQSYPIYQGNCTWGGHHGNFRFSYDFLMPIGAQVTAARSGFVIATLEGFDDGNNGIENWVRIQHSDTTIAAYSHLHSVLVKVGNFVNAGDVIGLSGNTGQTGGVPHLHFHVAVCPEPRNCGTLPVSFRNTAFPSAQLVEGQIYEALPLP